MTHPQQIADVPAKSVEQANYGQDSTLTGLSITSAEDNKLFIKDKSSTGNIKTIDLSLVDIYKREQNDDHAYGPDRRDDSLKYKAHDEVKASAELRFDNLDPKGVIATDRLDLQVRNTTVENLSAKRNLNVRENEPKSNSSREDTTRPEKANAVDYLVKPGDNIAKIAKQLAGKDATPQEIDRLGKEIAKLNGWKDGGPALYPGERINVPADKAQLSKTGEQQQREAREKLTKEAEEKFKNDPAKLEAFKENMRLFEQRAKRDKLSPVEIAKTYTEINRLLEAKGDRPLKPEQRKDIAEQIMRQAADPTTIDQGQHNTCNMTTVESRMYTRNPSDAARLVTDVALTGQYVATDGRRVRLNPGAHDEARHAETYDGGRSHASEIFQVAAVNLHIHQENRRTNPPGQLRYEQHPVKPGTRDTGERIIDYGVKPPKVMDYHPKIYDYNLGNLRDVYAAITGKSEKGIVIAHDGPMVDTSDGVTRINSERQLNEELAKAKREGKLPLIVTVDTAMEPFWTDSGAGSAGGSGGKHVVTITDYTPGRPAKVTIDNSWGKGADHDATRPITVHVLYQAIKDKDHAINVLEKDVKAAKEAGRPDTYSELDLAGLKRQENRISAADYEKEIVRLSKEVGKMPHGEQRVKTVEKLRGAMNQLEPDAALRILREQKKDGMLTTEQYKDEIDNQAYRMLVLQWKGKRDGTWSSNGQIVFEKGVKELMESIKDFTPEEIRRLRDYLKGRRQGA
ncbi:MAG: hypothetical protein IPP97_16225 [Candidatus Obscuribacter sp.]|jgi:hypothetical protein|nr:hypothetical protein [Candidatus Obscuribacter sp.]MBP6350188.1 hypothetical protein [Candidatus Obscuribacter sp.]MBP6593552.1 hypothetical protein [Candidatus Obscuribacter sp.]MBP7576589.1 hypothetical protein [Candidatus Obscuribacter sp.]